MPGQNGIGDVPMFANEEGGVFLERSRATVGEVISRRAGTDDHQLAAPTDGVFRVNDIFM